MITIIENNYSEPVVEKVLTEVKHKAYDITCPKCNSKLHIYAIDLKWEAFYDDKAYECPCCHAIEPFGLSKAKRHDVVTQEYK